MKKKYLSNLLAVGCWNIDGLYDKVNGVYLCKMDEEVLQKMQRKFDILCLQETHSAPENIFKNNNDFVLLSHCREKSANNRYFGGILLMIRKNIRCGVKVGQIKDRDLFEITLNKNFFGFENDLRILFTYASPISSCYTKARKENVLDKVESILINDKDYDNGIIMGDLNGRTNIVDDFVRDADDKHSPINNPVYIKDNAMKRHNMDKKVVDEQGKKILGLCKQASYRILNGRTRGDLMGKFTRYPKTLRENPSVIDYCLCSVGMLTQIHSFSVLPFNGLSDHCCIATYINANITRDKEVPDPENIIHNIKTYRYNENLKELFEKSILQDNNLIRLEEVLRDNTRNLQDKIDDSVTKVNNIILSAAKIFSG